jgi:hypothetical protein
MTSFGPPRHSSSGSRRQTRYRPTDAAPSRSRGRSAVRCRTVRRRLGGARRRWSTPASIPGPVLRRTRSPSPLDAAQAGSGVPASAGHGDLGPLRFRRWMWHSTSRPPRRPKLDDSGGARMRTPGLQDGSVCVRRGSSPGLASRPFIESSAEPARNRQCTTRDQARHDHGRNCWLLAVDRCRAGGRGRAGHGR